MRDQKVCLGLVWGKKKGHLQVLACDPKFKPMYYSKEYNRLERKLDKYLAKSGWYETDDKSKSSWRSKLPVSWKGSKPVQRKVPDLKFTTVMQVQVQ